jgi:hypothetical protein
MTDHVCGSSNTAIFRLAHSNPIAWRVFTLLSFSGESSQTADGNKFCRSAILWEEATLASTASNA